MTYKHLKKRVQMHPRTVRFSLCIQNGSNRNSCRIKSHVWSTARETNLLSHWVTSSNGVPHGPDIHASLEKTNMSVCGYQDSDGCAYSIQLSQTKHNLNKTQSRQINVTMLTGQDITWHKLGIHSEYERVNIRLQFEQKASQLELCVQRMVYLFVQVIIQEAPLKYNMLNLALVYSL